MARLMGLFTFFSHQVLALSSNTIEVFLVAPFQAKHILNGFSNVFERYLRNSLSNQIEKILSNFMAAHTAQIIFL